MGVCLDCFPAQFAVSLRHLRKLYTTLLLEGGHPHTESARTDHSLTPRSSTFIEVVGNAQADGSISYVNHGGLGTSFDVEQYEVMVKLAQNPDLKKLMTAAA